MSSVKTQSRYDSSRHLNFITTAPWHLFFDTYTLNRPSQANNFTGSGALSAVLNTSGVAVTASDCPAGRILRTNGKKLYPDAAALDPTAYPDRTPLVGVFDYHSGLSGFIDPNATVFAIYNVDKPIDSLDGTPGSGANDHKGMSVYTGGNVTIASGSLNVGNRIAGTASFGNASFTATVASGTATLVVTVVTAGSIQNGMTITGGGIAGTPTVIAFVSGTAGGVGTYTISVTQVAARTPTGGTVANAGVVALNIPGITTSSLAFANCSLVQANLTVNYRAVCTADVLTITALIAAGTTATDSTSVVNYFVVN